MAKAYRIRITSRQSAEVADISLADVEDEQISLTRKIARVRLVDNRKDRAAAIKLCIMHQRRASISEAWEDADSFTLSKLKAGEQVRMILTSDETIRLYGALHELYAVANSGVPREPDTLGDQIILRVPPYERLYLVMDMSETHISTDDEKESIVRLLRREGKELFDVIGELEPNLFEAVAAAKTYKIRRQAVDIFAEELKRRKWSELEWDSFFKANKWIFGHGLDYRFLSEIQSQAHYGGMLLSGKGDQRGDYLMATQAQIRFTVLVEIKTPSGELVMKRQYRNKAHQFGEDLTGGISQLLSNCRTWVLEGSQSEGNREALEEEGIYTYEPKGILVIGHTEQLDTVSKRATFELLRRNLHNPQILTFDELLERAKYLVAHDVAAMQVARTQSQNLVDVDIDVDDIPF